MFKREHRHLQSGKNRQTKKQAKYMFKGLKSSLSIEIFLGHISNLQIILPYK